MGIRSVFGDDLFGTSSNESGICVKFFYCWSILWIVELQLCLVCASLLCLFQLYFCIEFSMCVML